MMTPRASSRDASTTPSRCPPWLPARLPTVPRAAPLARRVVAQVRACDVMTKTVHTVAPDDPMEHVLALMNRMRKRALPVVDGQRAVFVASFGPRGHDYRHPARIPWRERVVGSPRRAVARAWRSAFG